MWLTAQQWLALSANHGQWCLKVAKAQLTPANHNCRVQVRTTHLSFAQIPDHGCSGSLNISSNLSKHRRLYWCHHFYTLKFWYPPIKCKCLNMPPRECISRRAIKRPSLSLPSSLFPCLMANVMRKIHAIWCNLLMPLSQSQSHCLSSWPHWPITDSSLQMDYVRFLDLCSGHSLAQKNMDIFHFCFTSIWQSFSTCMDHPFDLCFWQGFTKERSQLGIRERRESTVKSAHHNSFFSARLMDLTGSPAESPAPRLAPVSPPWCSASRLPYQAHLTVSPSLGSFGLLTIYQCLYNSPCIHSFLN